jgi:hypothetical protein
VPLTTRLGFVSPRGSGSGVDAPIAAVVGN